MIFEDVDSIALESFATAQFSLLLTLDVPNDIYIVWDLLRLSAELNDTHINHYFEKLVGLLQSPLTHVPVLSPALEESLHRKFGSKDSIIYDDISI